jgi:hypothetical protein
MFIDSKGMVVQHKVTGIIGTVALQSNTLTYEGTKERSWWRSILPNMLSVKHVVHNMKWRPCAHITTLPLSKETMM